MSAGSSIKCQELLAKSDLNLCAQKYTVCYVLAQIMVVNSFMAHLYANKLQCSSKQKVPSRDMEILLQQKKLTKGSTHLDRDGTHGSSALENVFCQLLQLFDSPFGCFCLDQLHAIF